MILRKYYKIKGTALSAFFVKNLRGLAFCQIADISTDLNRYHLELSDHVLFIL